MVLLLFQQLCLPTLIMQIVGTVGGGGLAVVVVAVPAADSGSEQDSTKMQKQQL